MELAPFVVCPETLGPLEARDDSYWSPRAERLYPVREGPVHTEAAGRLDR